MKTFIATLFLSFFIFSRTDNEIITDLNTEKENTPTTRSAGDGVYDLLGYGYNCFYSDFKDPLYAKAKIIDLDRLEKGLGRDPITGQEVVFNPSKIETSLLHGKTETKTVYGSSVRTLTENLNINATAKVGTKDLNLFSLDLEATINSGGTSENRDAFYRVDALKMTRRITLPYTTPSRLKYFFTDEFLSDLKNLSGKDLLEKYGTHVMTDILLGGNFSAFYTGKYTSTESTQLLDFKASSNFLMSSITANVHYDNKLFNSFKNVNIYIKTQGGSQVITSIISQNANGDLDNVTFDYASWMNSVTTETESLIGIGNPDTKFYLLSEFIDDLSKKKEIELAIRLKKTNYTIGIILTSPYTKFNSNESGKGLLTEFPNSGGNTVLLPIMYLRPPYNETGLFLLELENDYIKLKRRENEYLDNTCKITINKNNNTQHWKIEFVNGNNYFRLKNIANNLYLSSFDLKFYKDSTVIDDNKLYWCSSSNNI